MQSSSLSPFLATSRSMLQVLLLGTSLMLGSSAVLAQSAPPSISSAMLGKAQFPSVLAAVKRDVAQFVQHNLQTRSGTLPNEFPLDINDIQDLKDAKIGYGFQVFTIDPKDIVAGRSDLSSMTKPTAVWRFVINLNDKPIGLATVEQVGGIWETVAYGGATLAKDVDAMAHVHGNADRSNLRFIRIFQAQSDFLEVVSGNDAKARFAPLHSARQSLLLQQRTFNAAPGKSDPGNGLLEPAEFMEPLRAAVKSNMEAFR
ncbi:hypothetical protein AAKU55_003278 [Oxalobacteraceae bacterium GrIS 1.11]